MSSDLLPEGEELRCAMRWVSFQLQDDPAHSWRPLVQEATFKFDLSPREAELLLDFYRQRDSLPGN